MYETLNCDSFSKLKQYDQDFQNDAFRDVEMLSLSESSSDSEIEDDEEPAPTSHRMTTYSDSDEDEEPQQPNDGTQNSLLAVGSKHNRSFVVRGNRIGVFKQNDDDQLEFATTIKFIKC